MEIETKPMGVALLPQQFLHIDIIFPFCFLFVPDMSNIYVAAENQVLLYMLHIIFQTENYCQSKYVFQCFYFILGSFLDVMLSFPSIFLEKNYTGEN